MSAADLLPPQTPEATRIGTTRAGAEDVPLYECRRGHSVHEAADSLDLRVIHRRDPDPTVAVIVHDGQHYRLAR